MQAKPIETIKKRFKNEWLLICVTGFDCARTLPLAGYLLTHSKDLDEVYEALPGADCTTIPIPIALQLGLDPSAAEEHATIITASGLAHAPVVEIPHFAALGVILSHLAGGYLFDRGLKMSIPSM